MFRRFRKQQQKSSLTDSEMNKIRVNIQSETQYFVTYDKYGVLVILEQPTSVDIYFSRLIRYAKRCEKLYGASARFEMNCRTEDFRLRIY